MNRCISLTIAYIGGGSMLWARSFMNDLALESGICGEIRLYDINTEAAKNNEIIGNRISADPGACGKWRYTTVSSLREALDGADFTIISIRPGDIELVRTDVHLPERLGIYQSVGDTVGPGGIIRALRTIPLFVEFAEAIKEFAPDAWVINYTNPMSLCLRTLYHVFPQIKAFGCCHEVFGTQELLAAMILKETGETASRSDITVNAIGLNHFTWFDRASYQGIDLKDMFSRFADKYYEDGFASDNDLRHDRVFTCTNRVKLDLFRRYGWIAAAGDRHLAEFMPGEIYLKDPETAESWGFHLTPAAWRIEDLRKKIVRTSLLVSGKEAINLQPSGEEGLRLIKALCGLSRIVSNVNLPNTAGQISNLPKATVVETNALFSLDDVRPVHAGRLTDDIKDLALPHAENQSEVLGAALSCDKEAVYRAFHRDPLLHGRCSEQDLCELADDMIKNTSGALPDGWK